MFVKQLKETYHKWIG